MYWLLSRGLNPSLFVLVDTGWVVGELFTLKDKDETGTAEKIIKILNKILLIDHKYLETCLIQNNRFFIKLTYILYKV